MPSSLLFGTLYGLLLLLDVPDSKSPAPLALPDALVVALGRLARGAAGEAPVLCIAGETASRVAEHVGLALLTASPPAASVRHLYADAGERDGAAMQQRQSRVAAVFGAQRFVATPGAAASPPRCALLVVVGDAQLARLGAVAAAVPPPEGSAAASYVVLIRDGTASPPRDLRRAAAEAGLWPVLIDADYVVARRPWTSPPALADEDSTPALNLLIERAYQLIREPHANASTMQRAACHLQRVLRSRPTDAAVRSDLGSVLAMSGLRGLAQAALLRAVAANHSGAEENLAVVERDIHGAGLSRTIADEQTSWRVATRSCNCTAELLLALVAARPGQPLASDAVRGVGPCADPAVPPVALVRARAGWSVVATTDTYVGRSIIERGEWAAPEIALAAQIVRPGDTVLDVGAHIGSFTLSLARLVGKRGRVHSWEPQHALFDLLSASIALNGFAQVTAHNAAVGSRSASALPSKESLRVGIPAPRSERWYTCPNYAVDGNFGALGISTQPNDGYRTAAIDVESLDESWREGAGWRCPSLIKIDVEGFESRVLEGAKAMLLKCRPAIIIENNCRYASKPILTALTKTFDLDVFWHVHMDPRSKLWSINNFAVPREDPRLTGLARDLLRVDLEVEGGHLLENYDLAVVGIAAKLHQNGRVDDPVCER